MNNKLFTNIYCKSSRIVQDTSIDKTISSPLKFEQLASILCDDNSSAILRICGRPDVMVLATRSDIW